MCIGNGAHAMTEKQLTELLGGPEAVNSYLKQQRAAHTPVLTDQSSITDAADEYQRMIGDTE